MRDCANYEYMIMKSRLLFSVILAACICLCSCRKEENKVLAVRLDKTSVELIKGETLQLNASVIPADENAVIEWFSEDESYVTVDQSGLVTAVAMKKVEESSDDEENAQAVSVYARYKDGAAECEVTVLPLHARSIRLVPDQKAMKIGEQLLLNVEYTPADADVKDVEWSTSVAAVATVKDGVVVAKGYGTCEIIAKCGKAEARTYIIVL